MCPRKGAHWRRTLGSNIKTDRPSLCAKSGSLVVIVDGFPCIISDDNGACNRGDERYLLARDTKADNGSLFLLESLPRLLSIQHCQNF